MPTEQDNVRERKLSPTLEPAHGTLNSARMSHLGAITRRSVIGCQTLCDASDCLGCRVLQGLGFRV